MNRLDPSGTAEVLIVWQARLTGQVMKCVGCTVEVGCSTWAASTGEVSICGIVKHPKSS